MKSSLRRGGFQSQLARNDLPPGFVGSDRHGAGQVQAAGFGSLGNAQRLLGLPAQQRARQPLGLAAEYQGIARSKRRVGVAALGRFREPPAPAAEPRPEGVPTVHRFPLQVLPVVESGPAQVVVIDAKAERSDEPQLGSEGDARAADVARVLRDLWLVEHDMQQRLMIHSERGYQVARPPSSGRSRAAAATFLVLPGPLRSQPPRLAPAATEEV